ncbi:MAG: DUF1549 domain-containing protein [Verrucomicrobiaceae bacterium]|nr:DUF1549 domain-containing protein [Verrucomicrobiaceae bacterium]
MKKNLFLTTISALVMSSMATAASINPLEAAKKIDSVLESHWAKQGLKINPAADDNTLVRRLYIDIIGRIPTTRETEEFLQSKSPTKRQELITKLLNSEGYVQNSFNYWADVLRAQSAGGQIGAITGAAYTNFIKDSLRSNKPYDQFVREMIAATGQAWDNGAIGYYMRDRGMPLDNMATTARIFLGTRIECAQCHNHPFDKWTQKQFYEMAAFTYPVNTNDYYGGGLGEVRDMMRAKDQDKKTEIYAAATAAKAASDQADRALRDLTRRPPTISKKATPEERKALTEAHQQKVKAATATATAARASYDAERKKAEAQYQLVRTDLSKESRAMDEALRPLRDPVRYTSVSFQDTRKLALPHDYQYDDAKPKSIVAPATMMGHAAQAKPGESQLETYANWMTSPQNPRFTTVIANRMWKRAFGMALIEPLDEILDTSAPMIPELMKELEQLMIASKYDLRTFQAAVFNTRAYQAKVTREEVPAGVAYNFTGPILRRMSPEQMWDSFVALINPNPDMPNTPLREASEYRILAGKKIADATDAVHPDVLFANAQKTAMKIKDQADRTRELTAKISAARDAKNDALVRTLREEQRAVERATRAAANRDVVLPAFMQLAKDKGVVPTVYTPGKDGGTTVATSSMDMMMAAAGGDDAAGRIFIPGYDKAPKSKEETQADKDANMKVWAEEAAYYKIPEKQQRAYFSFRAQQNRDYVRSAELPSPAPRGHYLREFGQSDRETIENANLDASVPQALAMMNGSLLPQIMNQYSQLMLTINKAPYPDDKVEAAYMALFSRKPTDKERQTWIKASETGLTSMEDLIFALINTQQFIFNQ